MNASDMLKTMRINKHTHAQECQPESFLWVNEVLIELSYNVKYRQYVLPALRTMTISLYLNVLDPIRDKNGFFTRWITFTA
jgi:hypothetical protein